MADMTQERNQAPRELNAEEAAHLKKVRADALIQTKVWADAEAQKATDKASGNQKLLDLGLTQAEVDAL